MNTTTSQTNRVILEKDTYYFNITARNIAELIEIVECNDYEIPSDNPLKGSLSDLGNVAESLANEYKSTETPKQFFLDTIEVITHLTHLLEDCHAFQMQVYFLLKAAVNKEGLSKEIDLTQLPIHDFPGSQYFTPRRPSS